MLIQPTKQSPTVYSAPAFRGANRVLQSAKSSADTFVRTYDNQVISTVESIRNFLSRNKLRIFFRNGKFFNKHTTEGDSLLLAFLHIKPLEEEKEKWPRTRPYQRGKHHLPHVGARTGKR